MAKAYKCDRCGKLFEKYEGQGTRMFYSVTKNPCSIGCCLDLCQNCNAELQAWVRAESEDKDADSD